MGAALKTLRLALSVSIASTLLLTTSPVLAASKGCAPAIRRLVKGPSLMARAGRVLFPPVAFPIDLAASALKLHREGKDRDLWKSPYLAFRKNPVALVVYALLQGIGYAFAHGNLPAPDFWDQALQSPSPPSPPTGASFRTLSSLIQLLVDNGASPDEIRRKINELLKKESVAIYDENGDPIDPGIFFGSATPKPFLIRTKNNHGKILVFRVEVLPAESGRAEISITAYAGEFKDPNRQTLGETRLSFESRDAEQAKRERARLNDFMHQAHNLPEGLQIQSGKDGKAEKKFRKEISLLSLVTRGLDLADRRDAHWGTRLIFGSHSTLGSMLDLSKGLTSWIWNDMSRVAKPIAEPTTEVNDGVLARGPEGFADGARITAKVAPDQGYREYYVEKMLPISVSLHQVDGLPLKMVESNGRPSFTLKENLDPSPYSQFYRKLSGTKGMNIRLDEADFYVHTDGPGGTRRYFKGKVLVYSADVILNTRMNMRPHFWVYTGPSGKNYFVKFSDWAGVSENGLAQMPLNLVEVPRSEVPGVK